MLSNIPSLQRGSKRKAKTRRRRRRRRRKQQVRIHCRAPSRVFGAASPHPAVLTQILTCDKSKRS
jgi:hypothetical protein